MANKQILDELKKLGAIMPNLEEIATQAEQVGSISLNALISPEVQAAMTDEQKEIVKEARSAFKLTGNQSMADKLASLQETLSKIK